MLDSSVVDEKYFNSKIQNITYPYGLTKKRFYFYTGNAEDIIILKVDEKNKIETILRKKDDRILNIIRNLGFERKIKKELSKIPIGEYIVDVKSCEVVYSLSAKTEINYFTSFPQSGILNYKNILVIGIDTENKEEKLYFIENVKTSGMFSLTIIQSRSLILYKPKEITEFGSEIFCKLTQKRLKLEDKISIVNYKDYMIPNKEISYLSDKNTIKLNEFINEMKNEEKESKEPENEIFLSEIIRSGYVPKVEKITKVEVDVPLTPLYDFTDVEISTSGWLIFKVSKQLTRVFYDSLLARLKEFISIEEIVIVENTNINDMME
jgi:hypothetical protein